MKIIITSIIVYFIITGNLNAQFLQKISLTVNSGLGFDLQKMSKFHNAGDDVIYITSLLGNSIVDLRNPRRFSLNIRYDLLKNLSLGLEYGKTYRDIWYWGKHKTIASGCIECKSEMLFDQNNFAFFGRLQSDLDGKLNFFFAQGFGFAWFNKSNRQMVNEFDDQVTAISLRDGLEWYLIHTYGSLSNGDLAVNLSTSMGCIYTITNSINIEFQISIENEFYNSSQFIIWNYNQNNKTTFGETTYYLQFKSVFSTLGFSYRF